MKSRIGALHNPEVGLKAILIGDSNVGKTQLFRCLLHQVGGSSESSLSPTVGCDFGTITKSVFGTYVKLKIWDTSGDERFRTVVIEYMKGADFIIIVYDVTSRDSFESVSAWLKLASQYGNEEAKIILVGNKADLSGEQHEVSVHEAYRFANRNYLVYGCLHLSASTGANIDSLLHYVANYRCITDKSRMMRVNTLIKLPSMTTLKNLSQELSQPELPLAWERIRANELASIDQNVIRVVASFALSVFWALPRNLLFPDVHLESKKRDFTEMLAANPGAFGKENLRSSSPLRIGLFSAMVLTTSSILINKSIPVTVSAGIVIAILVLLVIDLPGLVKTSGKEDEEIPSFSPSTKDILVCVVALGIVLEHILLAYPGYTLKFLKSVSHPMWIVGCSVLLLFLCIALLMSYEFYHLSKLIRANHALGAVRFLEKSFISGNSGTPNLFYNLLATLIWCTSIITFFPFSILLLKCVNSSPSGIFCFFLFQAFTLLVSHEALRLWPNRSDQQVLKIALAIKLVFASTLVLFSPFPHWGMSLLTVPFCIGAWWIPRYFVSRGTWLTSAQIAVLVGMAWGQFYQEAIAPLQGSPIWELVSGIAVASLFFGFNLSRQQQKQRSRLISDVEQLREIRPAEFEVDIVNFEGIELSKRSVSPR